MIVACVLSILLAHRPGHCKSDRTCLPANESLKKVEELFTMSEYNLSV